MARTTHTRTKKPEGHSQLISLRTDTGPAAAAQRAAGRGAAAARLPAALMLLTDARRAVLGAAAAAKVAWARRAGRAVVLADRRAQDTVQAAAIVTDELGDGLGLTGALCMW